MIPARVTGVTVFSLKSQKTEVKVVGRHKRQENGAFQARMFTYR